MKERSKERIATLMMEELLEQLAGRENIKKMLADMTSGVPVDEMIEKLLDEFEQLVDRHHREILESRAKKRTTDKDVIPSSFTVSESPSPPGRISLPPLDVTLEEPKSIPYRPIDVSLTSPIPDEPLLTEKGSRDDTKARSRVSATEPPAKAGGDDEIILRLRKRVEDAAKKRAELEEEVRSRATGKEESVPESEDLEEVRPRFVAGESVPHDQTLQKNKLTIGDDEYIYLHAISEIPGHESPSEFPFTLEEKGIDGRGFAFAMDYRDLRFFMSKINPEEMKVSRTGLLLLGKNESIQAQGSHQNILNDLRMHGVLLPFEFGTIVRGKHTLVEAIGDNYKDIRSALSDLLETTWWTVTVSALDARMAQVFGTETPSSGHRREREVKRASYSSIPPAKKLDIKTLERILNKEKKLAESIHEELQTYANRTEIEMIVGLGSGSSEEWKPILKAAYEVKEGNLRSFNRTVTDVQYHHIVFDLMIAVAGKHEAYAFPKA